MAISYQRLKHLLLDRNLKLTDLKKMTGISSATLAKINKNEPISLETIEKICSFLDCEIQDVVQIHFTHPSN